MSDLRLILLIIGCFIVLGVYLWEISKKKQRRRKIDIFNTENEITDAPITSNSDFSGEDYNKAISDLTELSAHLQTNNTTSEKIIPSAGVLGKYSKRVADTKGNDEIYQGREIENNILSFYITAKTNNEFNGLAIKKILTDIGMVYGDMNIFHYYEEGLTSSDDDENEIKNKEISKPFFSVANMYEPGTFPTEIEKLHTKGIVAFMCDVNSINSYKIFESVFFVNIERIVRHLDAEINTSNHRPLDATSLKSIREKLRLIAMKDFLKNETK